MASSKEIYDYILEQIGNTIPAGVDQIYYPHQLSESNHDQDNVIAVVTYEPLSSEQTTIGKPTLYKTDLRFNIDIETNIKQAESSRKRGLLIADIWIQALRSANWENVYIISAILDEVSYNVAGKVRYRTRISADFTYYTRSDEQPDV